MAMKNTISRYLILAGCFAAGLTYTPTQAQETPCGTVDVNRNAPTSSVIADVDGDGTAERYVANWGNIQVQRARAGSSPTTWEVVSNIPIFRAGDQYSCVDIITYDRDGDGDLDLAHASHRGVTDFENRGNRLVYTDFYPLRYGMTDRVHLSAEDRNGRGLVDLVVRVPRRGRGESLILR